MKGRKIRYKKIIIAGIIFPILLIFSGLLYPSITYGLLPENPLSENRRVLEHDFITNVSKIVGTYDPQEAGKPIAVYNRCDFTVSTQGAVATCKEPQRRSFEFESTWKLNQLVSKSGVKIGDAPTVALFNNVRIEQYDKQTFVVLIKDQVSEKRYPTKLWELP